MSSPAPADSPGSNPIELVSGTFSRRFFLNAALPTFVFFSALTLNALHQGFGLASVIRSWNGLTVTTQIIAAFLYLASTYLLAAVVASQWRGIVRIYEGYPLSGIFNRSGRDTPGVGWHRAERDALNSEDGSDQDPFTAYYRYAETEGDILPTRLGNILLAGEQYPNKRYGIDGIIFWPRLFPLLPDSFKIEYEEFQLNYEFPLVVSFEAAATTLASSLIILLTHGSPLEFLAVLLGGSALSYLFYALSLSGAIEVAEQQRVAFDLYRNRLLESWPTVADVRDERDAFELIKIFVVTGQMLGGWDRAQRRYLGRRPTLSPIDQPAQPPQGPL